jgi:DNA mismatch repair protein MLH3
MPVRVKHRALQQDDRTESDRSWEILKLGTVALLISWDRAVKIKIKDADSDRTMTVGGHVIRGKSSTATLEMEELSMLSTTSSFSQLPSLLIQAGLLPSSNSTTWVPASASSRTTSVRGLIALQPMPTKDLQFLSLDSRPLARGSGHNELYEHINRLFKSSSFGLLENTEKLAAQIHSGAKAVRRYQLHSRKGVERWPMFYLKITMKKSQHEDPLANDGSLGKIVDVLEALVMGWLSAHHFRSGGKYPTRSSSTQQGQAGRVHHDRDSARRSFAPGSGKQSWTMSSPPPSRSIKWQELCPEQTLANDSNCLQPMVRATGSEQHSSSPRFSSEPPLPRQLNVIQERRPASATDNRDVPDPVLNVMVINPLETFQVDSDDDYFVNWTDPITNRMHKVNARTGMPVLLNVSKDECSAPPKSRLTIRPHSAVGSNRPAGWIDKLLGEWDNPVFHSTEQVIRQVSFEVPDANSHGLRRGHCQHFGSKGLSRSFQEQSQPAATRFTKKGLRSCRVISQIDNKFILIAIPGENVQGKDAEMLVAVDQHAADERFKVEGLLLNLCTEPAESTNKFKSRLGFESLVQYTLVSKPLVFRLSLQESVHFQRQAADFAEWGILYDIEPALQSCDPEGEKDLIIRALPTLIAERSSADPELLIELLRTELWHTVESGKSSRKRTTGDEDMPHPINEDSHSWLRKIGRCPKGILDMVASRACRSAIMFNDPLSREECEDLIQRLSGCAFPFQCAHGRPSMVPLIRLGANMPGAQRDMGGIGLETRTTETAWYSSFGEGRSFADAYLQWTCRESGATSNDDYTS